MTGAYDPGSDGAKMNFGDAMSYGDYLRLDTMLDLQHPISDVHDEMLFVIDHHPHHPQQHHEGHLAALRKLRAGQH